MTISCCRSNCYGYVVDLYAKKSTPRCKMVISCKWKAYKRENKMYKCWVLREGNRITPITGTGWSSNNVVTAYGHIPLTIESHLWISARRSVASCTQQSYVQHAFSLPPVSARSIPRFSVGLCRTTRLLTRILIKLYINLRNATTHII